MLTRSEYKEEEERDKSKQNKKEERITGRKDVNEEHR